MIQRCHPLAWGGFLLNAVLILMLTYSSHTMDLSTLSEEDKELVLLVKEHMAFFVGVIALQLVGLYLLSEGKRVGFIAAGLGIFFLLPISLIYGIGCMFTYFKLQYKGLDVAHVPAVRASKVYPAQYTIPFFATAAILGGYSMFFSEQVLSSFTIAALGFFSFTLYYGLRSMTNPPLGFYEDCLTIVPNPFALRMQLPYSELESAQILPNKRILFTLNTKQGKVTVPFSFLYIKKQVQEEALKELATVLRKHNVALL